MFAIHPTNDTESVREENMASLLHAMRQSEMKQTNSEPSAELYFHVIARPQENSPDFTEPVQEWYIFFNILFSSIQERRVLSLFLFMCPTSCKSTSNPHHLGTRGTRCCRPGD
ncbi:hypothetical protein Tco_0768760 [Tanacetum coccineum]